MSIMFLLCLLPHWLSGKFFSAMAGRNLLSKSLTSILLVMESKLIPGNWINQTFHTCSCTGYDDCVAKIL